MRANLIQYKKVFYFLYAEIEHQNKFEDLIIDKVNEPQGEKTNKKIKTNITKLKKEEFFPILAQWLHFVFMFI